MNPIRKASGVTVSDACLRAYEDIRNSKIYRFVIFSIVGNKIDVDQVGKSLRLNNKFNRNKNLFPKLLI